MAYPANLLYSTDHEWLLVDGNTATIGITEFAQGELGDIVFVDIASVGKTLAAGDVFGTVEAVKTVSDLFMPVAGKVEFVNPDLDASPELVNEDAYGKGWMVKITLSNPEEVHGLLNAEAYQAHVGA